LISSKQYANVTIILELRKKKKYVQMVHKLNVHARYKFYPLTFISNKIQIIFIISHITDKHEKKDVGKGTKKKKLHP